jgi:hypothetical protein
MKPRTHTPDRTTTTDDGHTITHLTLTRCCNGCGQPLGDADERDIDQAGNPTDVRGECPNCRPLVDLEAAGCRTWHLTPQSYARVDYETDRDGVFAKNFTEYVGDRLTVVGMRIAERPNHVVARFGDWIIRHPDGRWSVHQGPATTGQEGA